MNPYHPKNILVTGGAGFIGSNLVRYLLGSDTDIRIVNLDKLTYAGSLDNLVELPAPDRYTFVKGDICDRALVEGLVREHEIDTIIHLAAESHVDRSISDPGAFIETNVFGTYVLLDAVREYWLGDKAWGEGDCRFHHVSTDEVYGSLGPNDPAFSELTPYAPNSPYSASKAGADHLVRAYHHTYGLPVVTTNCSNNYGPFQHSEKFIPTVVRSCIKGEQIPVYGDGTNIRDWLYVEDHCRGIDAVVRNGVLGRVYNIGGGNEWANNQIAIEICRQMDALVPENAPHERLISYVTDRPGHDWRYAIDGTRIESELGWKLKETFSSGLDKTINWYLALWAANAAMDAG